MSTSLVGTAVGMAEGAAVRVSPSSLVACAAPVPGPCTSAVQCRSFRVAERLHCTSGGTRAQQCDRRVPFARREALDSARNSLQSGGGESERRSGVVQSGNGAVLPQASEEEARTRVEDGTAVVWFKRDLRVDDHPGLVAAASYRHVLPVYIFDPDLLAGWSAALVESLQDAVGDLRKSLQTMGSDLIIRVGRTSEVLCGIASKVGALDIIAEEEVEMEWHQVVCSVSDTLSEAPYLSTDMLVKQWRGSIYEIEGLKDVPDCYKTFQKQKRAFATPLDSPATLPALPKSFDQGLLHSVEEIVTAIASIKQNDKDWEDLKAAQEEPAETVLGGGGPVKSKWSATLVEKDLGANRSDYRVANPREAGNQDRRKGDPSAREPDEPDYRLKGGATGALNILRGYLRFLEPTGRDDWQELHEHVTRLETRPGASFRALFGNALALGTLSLRRIYQEAIEYERARGGGWLSPFGFSSFTAAAAVRDSKAIEWYQLLALKTREQGRDQGFQVGTWRWRGFLIQYALAGATGPAVVFVHGFGAFWQHWRDNIESVAACGYRVFALTMLGFGRSEKPSVTYTDLVWAELVRDFIIEVVREPAVVAGNSIGGYTVSVVAGLWPNLVKSVVLLNSAGRVIPNYESLKYNRPREKSSVAYIGSRLLLAYLQNLSNGMLTKCYPTNPWRADNWLQGEVMRAFGVFARSVMDCFELVLVDEIETREHLDDKLQSYDPNATAVLEAMFHLRAPLPLNYYLNRYEGEILVIQGMRDPLHNSSKRASMLQAYCKNVSIQYVNAGHCPHDEVPEDVNLILTTWLKERKTLKSKFGMNNGSANGAAKLGSTTEAAASSASKETSSVLPDILGPVKEEIEELV